MTKKLPNSKRNLDIAINRIVGAERAHDLIDLQVIVNSEMVDYPLMKNACERLFVFRRQQSWPSNITKNDGWDMLYERQVNDLDVFKNVDDAIAWGNELIKTIDDAITET